MKKGLPEIIRGKEREKNGLFFNRKHKKTKEKTEN